MNTVCRGNRLVVAGAPSLRGHHRPRAAAGAGAVLRPPDLVQGHHNCDAPSAGARPMFRADNRPRTLASRGRKADATALGDTRGDIDEMARGRAFSCDEPVLDTQLGCRTTAAADTDLRAGNRHGNEAAGGPAQPRRKRRRRLIPRVWGLRWWIVPVPDHVGHVTHPRPQVVVGVAHGHVPAPEWVGDVVAGRR